VKIGTGAAQFPEKEYIIGILFAVEGSLGAVLRIWISQDQYLFEDHWRVKMDYIGTLTLTVEAWRPKMQS
jgi:hypothetical protein